MGIEGRYFYLGESENSRELQSIYDFIERHDLARCVKGEYIQPIMLMREGNQMLIATEDGVISRPLDEVIDTLQNIGDFISKRIESLKDESAKYWCDRWINKDHSFSLEKKLPLVTNLSIITINDLQENSSVSEFWELQEDIRASSEILAVARMSREVPNQFISIIIEKVRSAQKIQTSSLDAISNEAINFIRSNKFNPLYKQGYILAKWLREKLEVKSSEKIFPREIIEEWGVNIEEIDLDGCQSLQAVSCWGPQHGPTIFLNMKGKYNKSISGQRATLAHEICHLLLDRNTSLPLVEVLGGDTPYGVEKRANAFAAELLLPRIEVEKFMETDSEIEKVASSLSTKFSVGYILIANQILNSPQISLERSEQIYIKNIQNQYIASPLFALSLF